MGKIIKNGISYTTSSDVALNINYDNSTSGIAAGTVQAALDELAVGVNGILISVPAAGWAEDSESGIYTNTIEVLDLSGNAVLDCYIENNATDEAKNFFDTKIILIETEDGLVTFTATEAYTKDFNVLLKGNVGVAVGNGSGSGGEGGGSDVVITLLDTAWEFDNTTNLYKQEISLGDVTVESIPVVGLLSSDDADIEAYSHIVDAESVDGAMIFYADEILSIAINIAVKGINTNSESTVLLADVEEMKDNYNEMKDIVRELGKDIENYVPLYDSVITGAGTYTLKESIENYDAIAIAVDAGTAPGKRMSATTFPTRLLKEYYLESGTTWQFYVEIGTNATTNCAVPFVMKDAQTIVTGTPQVSGWSECKIIGIYGVNGGNNITIGNLGEGTGTGSGDTIVVSDEWKLVGSATGTAPITLPEDYHELMITSYIANTGYMFSTIVNKDMIENGTYTYLQDGFAMNYRAYWTYTSTSIALNGLVIDSDMAARAITTVYYRDNGGVTISEKDVYSTEEQEIGTWIDGKPIYRKVYTGEYSLSAANQFAVLDETFKPDSHKILNAHGLLVRPDGNFTAPSPYISFQSLPQQGLIMQSMANYLSGTYEIVVEYTKVS